MNVCHRKVKNDSRVFKRDGTKTMIVKKMACLLKPLLLLLFVGYVGTSYAQVSADAGKKLFRNYCASCHDKKMKKNMTGPALAGMEERWAEFPKEDLYAWIRNSQALIASGHPRAKQLWEEYNGVQMTSYPNLTDDEIGSLIAYVNEVAAGGDKPTGGPVPPTEDVAEVKGMSAWWYVALLGGLVALSLVLFRVISSLKFIAARQDDPNAVVERKSIMDIVTSKGFIGFVLFAFVLLGGYTTVNNAVNLGRQQGYAPEQPIKFSHKTHAGLNKIDCQYCHDGARRSKHSVIPATNTCMNCHQAINFGSEHGSAEITKIYAAIGFDPINNKYIENYDNMPEAEIEKLYKEWFKQSNKENDEKMENASEEELQNLADDQWDALKASLTNDVKKKIQGPIEWIRIHNLPDHVYFNHAQHVEVGKVECQTCHGAVEEMDVVEQMSPLSMGWCVNCHRQTSVKFENNEYYSAYEMYHKELKNGDRKKVTVEDIGGLECQKCHY